MSADACTRRTATWASTDTNAAVRKKFGDWRIMLDRFMADAVSEQERGEMDLELVEEPGPQILLGDVRSAGDRDVLLRGGCSSLVERGLDPVGDEGERCSTLLDHRFSRMVREDEHRHAERWIVSPPSVRDGIVLPGTCAAAEHASAHDVRPRGRNRLSVDVVVGAALAARLSVLCAPTRGAEDPFVEPLAALAERLFHRPI